MYYRTIFNIAEYHKWDVASIENLLPYELQIYCDMIKEKIAKESGQQTNDGGYEELKRQQGI